METIEIGQTITLQSIVKVHPFKDCPGCGHPLDAGEVCWECGYTGQRCVLYPQYGCKGCGQCSKHVKG